MLFADLDEFSRRQIIRLYRLTNEFLRPLADVIHYAPNEDYTEFIKKIKQKVMNYIRTPIIEYFNGANIHNPRKWLTTLKELFLNILLVEYKPFYDQINIMPHKTAMERTIVSILRCNAQIIYNFHILWR